MLRPERVLLGEISIGGRRMTYNIGLDMSQKTTAVCVVEATMSVQALR